MTDKTPMHPTQRTKTGQTDQRPQQKDTIETCGDNTSDAGPKRSQKQPAQELLQDTDDAE